MVNRKFIEDICSRAGFKLFGEDKNKATSLFIVTGNYNLEQFLNKLYRICKSHELEQLQKAEENMSVRRYDDNIMNDIVGVVISDCY